MASYGVTPNGPSTSIVITGLQYGVSVVGKVLDRVKLGAITRLFRFMVVPNSTGGGTVSTTIATASTTIAHNTSPLWMPLFLEATLGKPATILTITFLGVPNAPGYVLVGVAVTSYMLFTTAGNAIQWAFSKGGGKEKAEEMIRNLERALEASKALVSEKEQALGRNADEIQAVTDVIREHQKQLSESESSSGTNSDVEGVGEGEENLGEPTVHPIEVAIGELTWKMGSLSSERDRLIVELHQAQEIAEKAERDLDAAKAEFETQQQASETPGSSSDAVVGETSSDSDPIAVMEVVDGEDVEKGSDFLDEFVVMDGEEIPAEPGVSE